MNTNSQNSQILRYLKSGKLLTPKEALAKFGCFRLAARIYDLKGMGHRIKSHLVTADNSRYSEYFI